MGLLWAICFPKTNSHIPSSYGGKIYTCILLVQVSLLGLLVPGNLNLLKTVGNNNPPIKTFPTHMAGVKLFIKTLKALHLSVFPIRKSIKTIIGEFDITFTKLRIGSKYKRSIRNRLLADPPIFSASLCRRRILYHAQENKRPINYFMSQFGMVLNSVRTM